MEEKKIPGTIKFFGCPAEETLIGKVFMAGDCVFCGVEALLSHHPGTFNVTRMGSSNAMNSHFYGRAESINHRFPRIPNSPFINWSRERSSE